MTIFERVAQIAATQKKSLKEPCYSLWISCSELERRLNALEPRAVEEVEHWLGIKLIPIFARDLGTRANK
jgi:hypothetical protein